MKEKAQPKSPRIWHEANRTGIFRVYNPARGCYCFNVFILRNKKPFQKSFSEKRHGSEQATLKMAQAWRDTIIAKYPAMSMAQFCAIVRSSNTSGVPGVYRKMSNTSRKNGSVSRHVGWTAHIPTGDGKRRVRNFSIETFGEDGARQRAIDTRLQGLADLDKLVFRAKQQPQPVSTADDIALLQARLRAPEERRQQLVAKRQARQQHIAQRAAQQFAQAQDAENEALRKPTNRSGEPYIGRYANPGSSAGYWRVSIVRQGTRHRKVFTDSVYGGETPALVAAKAWRDQLLLRLPVNTLTRTVTRVNATNTSGVAGVHRAQKGKKGKELPYWVANCPKLKGRPQRNKSFSIAKYGEEQAFALAVAAREMFVAELSEMVYLHHRAARQMMQSLQTV